MTRPHRRRGSQMLEFTLLMPIFMILILFTFDMGRLVMINTALHDAAQSAARAGAQIGGANLENSAISLKAFDDTAAAPGSVLDATKVIGRQVTTGNYCTASGPDRFVTFQATYKFTFLTPLLKDLVGIGSDFDNGFVISASAVSRCEVVK